ncbi:ser/Thr protein phosphatase [Metarhizium rileyi]|uniref:Ser/Thr protein phosphatase n=1 Tax=Metarhizium rileyi (strain RCEF 4871) TaxID=1649241 RepID=A0A167H734_METRR|nr:ser/Thr protein phosphatase [Metarhizium rileyi RCEF 4871]
MADHEQDLEICVPKSTALTAVSFLCSTGLFDSCEPDGDFNNYTEYKRHVPRIRTTSWCPPQTIVIFTTAFFGFDSIEDVLIPPISQPNIHISKEIQLNWEDIADLHLPRLAPLLKGLARRFLDERDDVAMIAVEQLVDGMDLDEAWVERQLEGSDAALVDLVVGLVRSKRSRIDYYMENKTTCFVYDEEEAERVRLIPGFE